MDGKTFEQWLGENFVRIHQEFEAEVQIEQRPNTLVLSPLPTGCKTGMFDLSHLRQGFQTDLSHLRTMIVPRMKF